MNQNTTPILIVEDDDIDRMTVKRVFKEFKLPNQLVFRPNGEDALEYLRNAGKEKPCLIFLDLNMPRMNGWELLEIIRADVSLSNIPVIILTTSDSEEDRKHAEQFRPIDMIESNKHMWDQIKLDIDLRRNARAVCYLRSVQKSNELMRFNED